MQSSSYMYHCVDGTCPQISGINAEVMPGQWEYQIGPVGPLDLGDEVRAVQDGQRDRG